MALTSQLTDDNTVTIERGDCVDGRLPKTYTPIVEQTIAKIVPHAREDQASTRLGVGTMPASAR